MPLPRGNCQAALNLEVHEFDSYCSDWPGCGPEVGAVEGWVDFSPYGLKASRGQLPGPLSVSRDMRQSPIELRPLIVIDDGKLAPR